MAEQSSAAVAVRASVMLGCLVAIPLVALFGHALPETIDRVAGTWWTPDAQAPAAGDAAEEAPLFEPLLRSPTPESASNSAAPLWPSQASSVPEAMDSATCDADGCRVLPAAYESPIEPSSDRGSPPDSLPHAGRSVSPSPLPHDQFAPAPPNQFHSICQRLKELGSTYVLLESWGDGQEQFRFYCKIALAGNPHYTYRFEATSPDPLAAMAEVLRQVEDWRAARQGN